MIIIVIRAVGPAEGMGSARRRRRGSVSEDLARWPGHALHARLGAVGQAEDRGAAPGPPMGQESSPTVGIAGQDIDILCFWHLGYLLMALAMPSARLSIMHRLGKAKRLFSACSPCRSRAAGEGHPGESTWIGRIGWRDYRGFSGPPFVLACAPGRRMGRADRGSDSRQCRAPIIAISGKKLGLAPVHALPVLVRQQGRGGQLPVDGQIGIIPADAALIRR